MRHHAIMLLTPAMHHAPSARHHTTRKRPTPCDTTPLTARNARRTDATEDAGPAAASGRPGLRGPPHTPHGDQREAPRRRLRLLSAPPLSSRASLAPRPPGPPPPLCRPPPPRLAAAAPPLILARSKLRAAAAFAPPPERHHGPHSAQPTRRRPERALTVRRPRRGGAGPRSSRVAPWRASCPSRRRR